MEVAKGMHNIKLADIANENWRTVCHLKLGKEAEDFGAPNSYSIA
jgi:hypothetical protein